jgi:xanthine dehydrogenase FAD-binding subunit
MTGTYRPRHLAEALAIRRDTGARPFSGGTDLMVRYRGYSGTVPRMDGAVLFLDAVEELKELRPATEGGLTIGAAVTYTEMLESPRLPQLLRRAVEEIAAPGIRNRGTMGGNLCNASPAGDTIPPLYIYEAEVELARLSAAGSPEFRRMAVGEFLTGPGRTAMAADEIVTAIHLPALPPGELYYRKVGTRKANALSKLSAAGYARIGDGTVLDFRFALGAVAPTVIRLSAVERALQGGQAGALSGTEGTVARLCALAEEAIRPIDDQRSTGFYRKTVALNALREFLELLGLKTVQKTIQPENGVSHD